MLHSLLSLLIFSLLGCKESTFTGRNGKLAASKTAVPEVEIRRTEAPSVAVTPTVTSSPMPSPSTLPTSVPTNIFGSKDDGVAPGLVGNVYDIDAIKVPIDTAPSDNFSQLPVVGTIVSQNLTVTLRHFTEGFPGIKTDLVEWFGIDFRGQILLPVDGDYYFRAISDDGVKLYVNENLIFEDFKSHSPRAVSSSKLSFKAGKYPIRVLYYQGPRVNLALALFWNTPQSATRDISSESAWEFIPPSAFSRPLGPTQK